MSAKPRRSWPRRVARASAWAGGLLCLAVLALYATRNTLLGPLLVERAQSVLQERFGLLLTVDELDGGWWSDLRVRGLSLRSAPGRSPLEELHVEELALEYDLRSLARGDLSGLNALRSRGVRARVDLARDESGDAADSGAGWPEAWPSIDLSRVDLDLSLPSGRGIALRGAELTFEASDAALALDAPDVRLSGDWGVALAAAAVHATGTWRSAVLACTEVRISGDLEATSRDLRVDVRDGWWLSSTLAAFDGEIELALGAGESPFTARWSARDIELEPALRFAVPHAAFVASGRASLEGQALLDDAGAWLVARGELRDACVESWAVDHAAFDVGYEPGALRILELHARRGPSAVHARELQIPLDREGLLATLRATRGAVSVADLELPSSAGVALPLHALTLEGRLDDAGVELRAGQFTTQNGSFRVRRGTLTWSADGTELLADSEVDVDLDASFQDLSEIGALFDDRRWSGRLEGALHLSGKLSAPIGELDLRGSDVVVSEYAVGELSARARTDGRRLTVQTLVAKGALAEIEIEGEYDLREERFDRARWSASTRDLSALLPEWVESGALELRAEVAGPLRSPEGSFEADASGLALRGLPAIGALHCAGELGPDSVHFASADARVGDVDWSASGTLHHVAWSGPFSLELQRALVKRAAVEVALAAPCRIELGAQHVAVPRFELAAAGGRASGAFETLGADFTLGLEIEDLDPMPLCAPFLRDGLELGRAGGTLTLSRSAGRYSGNGSLRVADARPGFGWPTCAVELSGGAAGDRVHLERLALHSDAGVRLELTGELPFDDLDPTHRGRGALQVAWSAAVDDASVLPWAHFLPQAALRGALQARGALAGAWPDLRGWLELDGSALALQPTANSGVMAALALDAAEISTRVSLSESLELERCRIRAPGRVELDAHGTLATAAAVRGALSGEAREWSESELALDARWSIADLAFLSGVWPAVRRIGGRTEGDASVRGTWAAPDARGSVQLHAGSLRLDTALPSFELIEAAARFEGQRLVVERCQGELGAGPFVVEGTVDLGAGPRFDLRVQGRELLLVQQRELRLRADAELTLKGPAEALVLAGDLRARDGRWVTNVDWYRPGRGSRSSERGALPLFSIPDGPFAALRFDVALRGGDAFRFETNVARGAVRADLTLQGTGRAPQLSGALFFESAQVLLSGTNLVLRSGTLTLDRRRPLSPELDLTLDARVRGYTIVVRVEGTYDEPLVELSSSPPLPGDDILALLLTQRAPGASFDGEAGLQAAETVIVYLGKDLVSRLFGAQSGIAERVEWQIGADVTQGGASTAQLRIRVLGAAEGEGRALYLRGERDVYDRINYGVRFVLRLR